MIKTLCTDKKKEFISIKIKGFYNKKGITLKYMILYIYENNGLVERDWYIILTIKDLLFLGNGLPLNF